jgi:hypothetical protein
VRHGVGRKFLCFLRIASSEYSLSFQAKADGRVTGSNVLRTFIDRGVRDEAVHGNGDRQESKRRDDVDDSREKIGRGKRERES